MDARLFTKLVKTFGAEASRFPGGRLELAHHAHPRARLADAIVCGGKMDLDNWVYNGTFTFYVDPKGWVAPGPTLQDTLWRR